MTKKLIYRDKTDERREMVALCDVKAMFVEKLQDNLKIIITQF